jgi:GntR family transcriptional regulator / MocR family aminotransferase
MQIQVHLDRSSDTPLQKQLYAQLRQLILERRIPSGQPLPSSRSLAEELGVARVTVTRAYSQLVSEGYIETQTASKTIVRKDLPAASLESASLSQAKLAPSAVSFLSANANHIQMLGTADIPAWAVDFSGSRPDLSEAPVETLSRLIAQTLKADKANALDYARDPAGEGSLRVAISEYLLRMRGIHCSANQIIVTGGWQQTLDLFRRVHLDRGDVVGVEDPCYPYTRDALAANGQILFPVGVDDQGLLVDKIASMPPGKIKAFCVVPSHHYPLGCVMSLARRLRLLAWAKEAGAMIFEDDFGSEFRYVGKPIPALKSLDRADVVVYGGTFNQVLFPSFSMGYLVVPQTLMQTYKHIQWLSSEQPPLFLQLALARFIETGDLERHIRKMERLYRVRRQIMVHALNKSFGQKVQIRGDHAGLHLLVKFQTALSTSDILNKAKKERIALKATESCYLGHPVEGEFMMSFAHLHEQRITKGVEKLARVLRD